MIYVMGAVATIAIFFAGYFAGRTSAFKEASRVVDIMRTRLKEIEDKLKANGIII